MSKSRPPRARRRPSRAPGRSRPRRRARARARRRRPPPRGPRRRSRASRARPDRRDACHAGADGRDAPAPSEPSVTGTAVEGSRQIHQSRRLSAAVTSSTTTSPGCRDRVGDVLDLEAGLARGEREAGCAHAAHGDRTRRCAACRLPARSDGQEPACESRSPVRPATSERRWWPRSRATRAFDEIVGIARRRPGDDYPLTRFVQADVSHGDLEAAFAGMDAVVHLAWEIQPSRRRERLWQTNVLGTKRVLEAASAAGVKRLVAASSVAAYAPGPKDRQRRRELARDGDSDIDLQHAQGDARAPDRAPRASATRSCASSACARR